MLVKSTIVLLACCALVNSSVVIPKTQQTNVEHELADVFMSYLDSFASNPKETVDCFSEYGPKIQAASEDYRTKSDKCKSDAVAGRQAVDEQVAEKRSSITTESGVICSKNADCSNISDPLKFFECFSANAKENSGISTTVGYKANEGAEFVKVGYQSVNSNEKNCIDGVSSEFNTKMTALQQALETCIKS